MEPWPWYVAGPMIAGIMAALLFAGQNFGMSSNLRTLCSAMGAGKSCDFFAFDWRSQRWNLFVMAGAVLGGYIAVNFLSNGTAPELSPAVSTELAQLGFLGAGAEYLPAELFLTENLSVKTVSLLLLGGLMVGFGARYAGGCTSGHAISGLSNLQFPSLIAVVGFFVGGLIMVYGVFPLIF